MAGLTILIRHMRRGWPGLGQKQKKVPRQSGGGLSRFRIAPAPTPSEDAIPHHLWPRRCPLLPSPAQLGAPAIPRTVYIPVPAAPALLDPRPGLVDPRPASPLTFDTWFLSLFADLFIYLLFTFFIRLLNCLINSCLW